METTILLHLVMFLLKRKILEMWHFLPPQQPSDAHSSAS